jgi:tetratricopeptide (TPR) repeat protein
MKKNSPKPDKKAFVFSFDFLIEVLFLVAVFITPVIFDRRLGIVFSGTKVAWLRALMVVVVSVWAIKLIVARQHRFIRTPLDWPVLSFLFSTTIATLTSVHVYTSFTGFYGRFEGLSTWYVFGLLFFVTTNYVHSFEQLKRIIATVVSAGVLMSVYGVIQRQELDPYMWGGVVTWQRVIGTIGQPNFLAAYILMSFFLALVLFLEEKKGPREIDWYQQLYPLGYFLFCQIAFIVMIYSLDAQDVLIWYIGWGLVTSAALLFAYTYERLHPLVLEVLLGGCLLLIYICLLYTQSRGGYLGFFTGGVLFALVAGRHWLFRNWKKIAVLGFLIVAVSAITMLNPQYSPFERFTAEVNVKKEVQSAAAAETESRLELKGAAGSRGETWKSAFRIIADYPLFGIGPEVLKMVFPRYETDLFRFKEAFHVKQDRCHNETFDVPVTKGLISFFLYLWILFTVFKTGFDRLKGASESKQLMIAGLLAAILSYLIQNQFSFGVVAITSLFWVMWGMVMKLNGEEAQETSQKLAWSSMPWLWVATVAIVALFLIYVSFLSFRGDVLFKSGKTYLEMRRLPEAVENFKASLRVFPFEGTTISHLGIAYLNMGDSASAIRTLNSGTAIDPYNADNFYMLARLYLSMYDQGAREKLGEAMQNVEVAIKIDPYYAEAYQAMGQIYERRGDRSTAAKMYQKTFMINPNLADAMRDLERVASPAEVFRAFEEAYKKYSDNLVVLDAIGRIYLGRGEIDKGGEIAARMTAVDPKNPAGYFLTGDVELRRGAVEKAFEAFQQVIYLDPQNVGGHNGLGATYLRQGNRERAKEEFEQALRLDPNNELAKRMLTGLR